MNALIIKEDGLIYVNEVPDHPCEQLPDHDCPICQGARDTAVLCADQGHANGVLYFLTDRSVYKTFGSVVVGFHPGIYPIEGLKFERKGVCCSPQPPNINHHGYCDECQQYSEVANLSLEEK